MRVNIIKFIFMILICSLLYSIKQELVKLNSHFLNIEHETILNSICKEVK